jgi:hypothetical protein
MEKKGAETGVMPAPRIPISSEHSVGTDAHPYHLHDAPALRTEAMLAGLRAREVDHSTRHARINLRKRLNALRVVNRRRPGCLVLDNDYAWITRLIDGAHAAPACLVYPRDEPGALRALLARLLFSWWAGPWSFRVRDGRAEVVVVPSLLAQRSPPDDNKRPDEAVVQKSASLDEFRFFLNYLLQHCPAIARRIARARTPKAALAVVAASWEQLLEMEDGAWRLRQLRSCPAGVRDCIE